MPSNNDSLVSIITPVYNAEPFLADTIQSVIEQSHRNWELLLIIDSNSKDQSLHIAQRYEKLDSRIFVIQSESNVGVARNRNNGLQLARGQFIAFLDADDTWTSRKLETQILFMTNNRALFSYHTYQQMNEQNQILPIIRKAPEKTSYKDLLRSNVIGCLTVMLDSTLAKQFQFKIDEPHEDFILWLELLRKIPYAYGIDENLARYRVLPQSRSGNKIKAALNRWHIYRHIVKLNFLKSIFYFINYTFYSLLYRFK